MGTHVEQVVDWFARLGFSLAIEWRDRTDPLPREYRGFGKGYWVDLVNLRTGEVFWPSCESGPREAIAVIGARQR